MFGKNAEGQSCSITVSDFKPFFYIKVSDKWGEREKMMFHTHLRQQVGKYHQNNIVSTKIVRHKKLYGFDNHREHTFIKIVMKNTNTFSKVRSLWYTKDKDFRKRVLAPGGYQKTILYEAKLPPLLRFFHIKDISPSGWISFLESSVNYESSASAAPHGTERT